MKVTVKRDGSTHYHSLGRFLGFGWMAKYNLKGACAYGKVTRKKGVTWNVLHKLYSDLSPDLHCMTQTLDAIIPGVVKKGQCITLELVKMAKALATESHEKLDYFKDGMITGMVCHNAQTADLHFEKDCAFTLIGIPFGEDGINVMGHFVFEFSWGRGNFI